MEKLIGILTIALYAAAMLFLAVILPMPAFMVLALLIIIMAIIYQVEGRHDDQ